MRNIEYHYFVSYRFLYWVLTPLSRSMDVTVDEDPPLEFPGLDSNNAAEMKERVIRPLIAPFAYTCDDLSQSITKNSFRYYLSDNIPTHIPGGVFFMPKYRYGKEFFQSMFDSMLPSFEGPKPIRLFFMWIWEELYGPEDYHIDSTDDFIVDDDRKHWLTVSEEF